MSIRRPNADQTIFPIIRLPAELLIPRTLATLHGGRPLPQPRLCLLLAKWKKIASLLPTQILARGSFTFSASCRVPAHRCQGFLRHTSGLKRLCLCLNSLAQALDADGIVPLDVMCPLCRATFSHHALKLLTTVLE